MINSKRKKRWVITPHYSEDLIDQILQARGITDKERFLNPEYNKHRYDANLLPGVTDAVNLIKNAINKNQTIGIFGDYDCDGIPGSALLYRGLMEIGADCAVYIPKRETGYGLNEEGVTYLINEGAKLIITVDCGITSKELVQFARSKHTEVIVTDHHEPLQELPECVIINPKLSDSSYPFRNLCGTGVVYKLLEALATQYPTQIDERWLKWNLDMVALATICDMVPLLDENRVLASYGLKVLQKTKNLGMQALIGKSGVDPRAISSYHVGYVLGPRINAIGRMDDDPILGWKLLTTNSAVEASQIATKMHNYNEQRQNILKRSLAQAEEMIQQNRLDEKAAIVLYHSDWSAGIIGLIAGKLLERYHRPIFVFEGKDIARKGSARSVPAFPLPGALDRTEKHFETYGGHDLAAGLTLKAGSLDAFSQEINDLASSMLPPEERIPHLHIDAIIQAGQINDQLVDLLLKLEPYGMENSKPRFLIQEVKVNNVRQMGNSGIHARGMVQQNGNSIPFVSFGDGEQWKEINADQPIDLVATVERNSWQGRTTIELNVVDWEKIN